MSARSRHGVRVAAFGKRLVIAAVSLASLGLAMTFLVSCIPVWPCALFEHFRVQYVECGLIVIGAAAALRLRGYFDIALIASLLNALPVASDLIGSARSARLNGTRVRALVLNVHTESKSYEQVRRLIADEKPDVIGLVEVDQQWLDAIAPALTGYTGRIEAPRADNFGVAIYARGEVDGAAAELAASVPTVVAAVRIANTQLNVIVTHPLPPMSGAALKQQDEQFEAVAARVRSSNGPVIVMGDLNATPWSRLFLRFQRGSGLCDTRSGFGLQATFPASSRFLRIPIDHVLVSCSVGVSDRRVGPDVGSDHLPVVVDLVLPQVRTWLKRSTRRRLSRAMRNTVSRRHSRRCGQGRAAQPSKFVSGSIPCCASDGLILPRGGG
jgi:endonuclease/exonuclease/phosphatase (EEP) superfamily protein YafD